MPTIYDNIDHKLTDGLRGFMQGAKRADFCVGYFNLRGWREVQPSIDALAGDSGGHCRLLIGMAHTTDDITRRLYEGREHTISNQTAIAEKKRALAALARQLTYGAPTNQDSETLRALAAQLQSGKLKIKLYTKKPLHAKLYLVHREDRITALAGFVGSSNLTLAGLVKNDELNVDVVEQDAAQKLSEWFDQRWDDKWCIDITADLIAILEESWAGKTRPPHHIYLKTAWHLSRDAIAGISKFPLPAALGDIMLEHQKLAVQLAAERLNRQRGVIVGDVVGLGKTLIATAIAKIFQDDQAASVLIICPPALETTWRDYCDEHLLAATILTIGKVKNLRHMRRYRLIIIDESHNLRNRESARHQQVREYIRENDSKIIMLTATPYNKAYADIASQLMLFNEPDADLGIRPENHIAELGGAAKFSAAHPNTPISSLSAFEKSEHVDDWRELMRLFMVRRTRRHVKENFAEYDKQKKRHYLTFADGKRFYFPLRRPRRLEFSMKQPGDQYAKLYSDKIVDLLGGLKLPRYGLQKYLDETKLPADPAHPHLAIIKALSRSGLRLRGFARVGLFKRLESSGEAFLLSIRRHIIRNATMLAALQQGNLCIGQVLPAHLDGAGEEDDTLNPDLDSAGADPAAAPAENWSDYQKIGSQVLQHIKADDNAAKFSWLPQRYFTEQLAADLAADAKTLMRILATVPVWDPAADRKLDALRALCSRTHKNDKILIFSQYKDTIDYIHRHLTAGIDGGVEAVHGGTDTADLAGVLRRFSPLSNRSQHPLDQTRILLATDRLSEGVNLQDAHIIVNYDLPWAIIRLIQRAGRVDRIGQRADTIHCYSAMPEDGVENIIKLRARLQTRMKQNAELVGTDEEFFEEKTTADMRRVYEESILLDDEEEDETDFLSRVSEIWRQAIKRDPALEHTIKNMPDVVFSAKAAATDAVIAYIQDGSGRHILAQLDRRGAVQSLSQYRLLEKMACPPDEPALPIAAHHHTAVAAAVKYCRENQNTLGGQLGGAASIRRKTYERLKNLIHQSQNTLLPAGADLQSACQQIHDHPLNADAENTLKRQLKTGITDSVLAELVLKFFRDSDLCAVPKSGASASKHPTIICSMGLIPPDHTDK